MCLSPEHSHEFSNIAREFTLTCRKSKQMQVEVKCIGLKLWKHDAQIWRHNTSGWWLIQKSDVILLPGLWHHNVSGFSTNRIIGFIFIHKRLGLLQILEIYGKLIVGKFHLLPGNKLKCWMANFRKYSGEMMLTYQGNLHFFHTRFKPIMAMLTKETPINNRKIKIS